MQPTRARSRSNADLTYDDHELGAAAGILRVRDLHRRAATLIVDNATPARIRHYPRMPIYYFHCLNDDADGTELPDDAAAQQVGREAFGEMIRDGTVAHPAYMEVVDAAGRRVAYFSFSTQTKR